MILLGTSSQSWFQLYPCFIAITGEEVIQMRQNAALCVSLGCFLWPWDMIQPDALGTRLLLLPVHERNLRCNFGAFTLGLLINIPLKWWCQRGGWHQTLCSGDVFFPDHFCARSYPPNTTNHHKHKQGRHSEKAMSSFMGDAKDLNVTCIVVVEVSQMLFWWLTVP